MAKATLSAPLVFDPRTADDLRIKNVSINFEHQNLLVSYDLYSSGSYISSDVKGFGGAAVRTWIGNQEQVLYERLMAHLGVSGSVG